MFILCNSLLMFTATQLQAEVCGLTEEIQSHRWGESVCRPSALSAGFTPACLLWIWVWLFQRLVSDSFCCSLLRLCSSCITYWFTCAWHSFKENFSTWRTGESLHELQQAELTVLSSWHLKIRLTEKRFSRLFRKIFSKYSVSSTNQFVRC